MEDKVLFQVTEDNLETGLRGVPVGYCVTSYVDPQKGLFYRGKAVSSLSSHTPEQVIFLLMHGQEGSNEEVEEFSCQLKNRGHCSQAVLRHIQSLPRQGHPMKLLSEAILVLGMLESQDDYKEDCLNIIAKVPHLVATVINYHAGWGDTPAPNTQLGYMENFNEMLLVPEADKNRLLDVLTLFNLLHYDHGGGNLSTFVGKAVASGGEDMYGALSSAMCALAGPLHGKANQDALSFVKDALNELGESFTDDDVEKYLRGLIEKKALIYGFGHAVLRAEDARATIFYDYSNHHFEGNALIKMVNSLRKVGPKVLGENPKISNPYPNVDAVSGSMLTAAGFGFPEYYTVLFGLSRMVGIAIQIVYERCIARSGKGTPIVRPKYFYKGEQ